MKRIQRFIRTMSRYYFKTSFLKFIPFITLPLDKKLELKIMLHGQLEPTGARVKVYCIYTVNIPCIYDKLVKVVMGNGHYSSPLRVTRLRLMKFID